MRVKKWSSVAAVVLAATLALSACSDKGDAKGDDTSASSSSSSGQGGDATLDQAGFFSEVTASQRKARTAHVTMNSGGGAQTMKAEGDIAAGDKPEDTAMSLTMDLGSQKAEMRLVDQTFYMNLGAPTGNKFAKIDLTDENNPIGKQYNSLLKNLDPTGQLEQLEKAVTKFEQKGSPKQIDGVEATPYEVTVDVAKLADSLGGLNGQTAGVPKSITYVMYVGPDKLPRQMSFDAAGTKLTMNYSKWGEKVDIKAPPAAQITDKNPFARPSAMS